MANRIIINDHLFKLFPSEGKMVQIANAKNVVTADDLERIDGGQFDNDYLRGYIHPETGKIADQPIPGYNEFTIGYEEFVQGYDELSDFAANLNSILGAQDNYKLIDEIQIEKLDLSKLFENQHEISSVEIEGRNYLVDVIFGELRLADRPEIYVPFNDLTVQNGKYKVYVYPLTGHLTYAKLDSRQVEYQLPQMVKIDPEGMALKYGTSIAHLGESDRELHQSYFQQFDGATHQSPTVEMLGERYSVDLRRMALFGIDDPKRMVNLAEASVDDGEKFLLYFNYGKDQFVSIDPGITEVPAKTIMLELPGEAVLDPVAAGKIYKHNPQSLLRQHVAQQTITARVHPIANSSLPRLVKQNRERQAAQQNRSRPSKRMRTKGI